MQNSKHNNTELDMYFKQYEICLGLADKISERRGSTNKFYSALLLAFISGIVALISNIPNKTFPIIVLSTLGIILCIIWGINIKCYRTLNKAKYDVITKMEKELPTNPLCMEFSLFEKYKYISLTKVEMFVPIVIGISFLSILLYSTDISSLLCHIFE